MKLLIKSAKYFILALLYDLGIKILDLAPPSSRITAYFARKLESASCALINLEKYILSDMKRYEKSD